MEIRQAALGEARAIAEVHVASWRWAYRELLPDDTLAALDVDEREAMWKEAIRDPAVSVLVADDGSAIVGFASVGRTKDDAAAPGTGELYAIYLERGATRTGVGRALLERAVEGLCSAGFSRASLWVLESNQNARRFYERAGWSWDGSRGSHQVQCANMPIVRYVRGL